MEECPQLELEISFLISFELRVREGAGVVVNRRPEGGEMRGKLCNVLKYRSGMGVTLHFTS